MNRLLKVFALTLMMVVGGQAMAQTRGAMFLGASFPMSDFAEFDAFDDFALTTNEFDNDDAGAGIGFNAGLKWYFNVGVQGLGVMLSVDGFYNGPSKDLKNFYREKIVSVANFAHEKEVTDPRFLSVLLAANYGLQRYQDAIKNANELFQSADTAKLHLFDKDTHLVIAN